jgi:hypothetical protein
MLPTDADAGEAAVRAVCWRLGFDEAQTEAQLEAAREEPGTDLFEFAQAIPAAWKTFTSLMHRHPELQ